MKVSEPVRQWLDEAATAIGGQARSRADVLLELETNIMERVDERTGAGQLPEEAVQDVLDAMGDPVEVGSSFSPARALLAPHQTRLFLLHTAIIFTVHFLLVVGATVADQQFAVGPLRIHPILDAKSILEVLTRAISTLLFDAGAVLCLYSVVPRVGRLVLPRTGLSVRPDVRRCISNACFLALTLVVINALRENLFALYLAGDDGVVRIPFVGPGISNNLLLLNFWIGCAIVREIAYAKKGETRLTLALDVVSSALGLFCLLRIVATGQLVVISGAALDALGAAGDSVAAVLNSVFALIALLTAAALAARLVRRAWRWKIVG